MLGPDAGRPKTERAESEGARKHEVGREGGEEWFGEILEPEFGERARACVY